MNNDAALVNFEQIVGNLILQEPTDNGDIVAALNDIELCKKHLELFTKRVASPNVSWKHLMIIVEKLVNKTLGLWHTITSKPVKQLMTTVVDTVIHSKAHDYEGENVKFLDYFPHGSGDVFVILHGKLLRLKSLLLENKQPQNESVSDNCKDLIAYTIFFMVVWELIDDQEGSSTHRE